MKTLHTKNSVISTSLTEDHDPKHVFFIDGVYYQQKGFDTEHEAKNAGIKKLTEVLKRKK